MTGMLNECPVRDADTRAKLVIGTYSDLNFDLFFFFLILRLAHTFVL